MSDVALTVNSATSMRNIAAAQSDHIAHAKACMNPWSIAPVMRKAAAHDII